VADLLRVVGPRLAAGAIAAVVAPYTNKTNNNFSAPKTGMPIHGSGGGTRWSLHL
jgi:hypothetical protein